MVRRGRKLGQIVQPPDMEATVPGQVPPMYDIPYYGAGSPIGMPEYHFRGDWTIAGGTPNFTNRIGGVAKEKDSVVRWKNAYQPINVGDATVAQNFNGMNFFNWYSYQIGALGPLSFEYGYPKLEGKLYSTPTEALKLQGLRFTGSEYLQINGLELLNFYGLDTTGHNALFKTTGSTQCFPPYGLDYTTSPVTRSGASFLFVIDSASHLDPPQNFSPLSSDVQALLYSKMPYCCKPNAQPGCFGIGGCNVAYPEITPGGGIGIMWPTQGPGYWGPDLSQNRYNEFLGVTSQGQTGVQFFMTNKNMIPTALAPGGRAGPDILDMWGATELGMRWGPVGNYGWFPGYAPLFNCWEGGTVADDPWTTDATGAAWKGKFPSRDPDNPTEPSILNGKPGFQIILLEYDGKDIINAPDDPDVPYPYNWAYSGPRVKLYAMGNTGCTDSTLPPWQQPCQPIFPNSLGDLVTPISESEVPAIMNGVLFYKGNLFLGGVPPILNEDPSPGIYTGGSRNKYAHGFKGMIYEFMMFPTLLTDFDKSKLSRELWDKYHVALEAYV